MGTGVARCSGLRSSAVSCPSFRSQSLRLSSPLVCRASPRQSFLRVWSPPIPFVVTWAAALVACSSPDASPSTDAGSQCGNRVVETGERCDDCNREDSDGCTSDCRLSPFHDLKASNTGFLDSFGQAIALSADGVTPAVGAPLEASAAKGVDGDQTSDAAPQSGAGKRRAPPHNRSALALASAGCAAGSPPPFSPPAAVHRRLA